ncbi:MAG: glycoside hydrolase family 3 C-terminal domain-containing protein [Oscillospiraceae bacterium]|jgi:beta-glucosidase|nr:glycoside hydrolase family 3 C-terminal domain-containing protein [Oscillospiraceae bacterium]
MRKNRDKFAAQAAELVAKMTVEEAAEQLRYDAPENARLGIPEYNYWNEALHGVARAGTATSFPQAIALAAMFDAELLRQIAVVISVEGRAKYNSQSAHGDRGIYKGLTFWSPNINIFRDPRWGRGHETYGEDPFLTSTLGVAFIEGLQGDGEILRAAACAKHFAVHSGPEKIRHEFDAVVSEKDLWETYLPAFETAVTEADVEAVMGAYNATLGEPCCASDLLLRQILREKWGFDGHVVSDCWAIRDFHEHHKVTATARESAALALNAGCDLNCGNTYLELMGAYNDGLVSEDAIRTAATHVLTTRFKLGILGGEGSEFDAIPFSEIGSKAHLALCEKAAVESAVLLKNDGILPLDRAKYKSIAVIGPNADSRVALKGNYYGTAPRYVTVLDGIIARAGNAEVRYAEGCKLAAPSSDFITRRNDLLAEAVATAENCDVTVLVVGLDETIEGEEMMMGSFGKGFEGDKADLNLPESQVELINAVIKTRKPVVLVLMAGSSVDLRVPQGAANVGAILNLWYPGGEGGTAAAKLLFGEAAPGGKLPVTFYNSTDDLPEFTDYAMANRTYRYYTGDVLYPFGYGLTYGELSFIGAAVEGKTVTVKTFGDATDTLQIYIKAQNSPFAPTNPVLCAFKKIGAGTHTIELPDSAFTVVNDAGERVSGGDKFTISVGFGQNDRRSLELGVKTIQLEVTL